MVETTRGITVKIPADLHAQVKAEQEALELTKSQYIQQVLEENLKILKHQLFLFTVDFPKGQKHLSNILFGIIKLTT